ncbi:hypothetical protein [Desulfoscipio sp. XC116]|uniref:hypothetical protein n=1 Tax=Desulfoscipio sp. XC116 TaxID=3144975 RepID=UPI00325BC75C
MTNQLKRLRRENNTLDKQVLQENNTILTNMVCYLRSSRLCEYDIEIIRKELTGMALEAQLRGESFGNMVGEDFRAFCDELMKSGRQKTRCEKILELVTILTWGLGILFVIELFFSLTLFNLFKPGPDIMPVTSGFLLSTLLTLVFVYGLYYSITRKAFELSGHDRKTKTIFILGFSASWTAIVLIKVLMKTVIFSITFWYPLIFFIIALVVIKYLNDFHANRSFHRRS